MKGGRGTVHYLARDVLGLEGCVAIGGVAVLRPLQALRRQHVAHVAVALGAVAQVALGVVALAGGVRAAEKRGGRGGLGAISGSGSGGEER